MRLEWINKLRPLLLFGVALSCQALDPQTGGRPNVLLIMVDDLGWMDLGFQGNEQIDTPNLDRLAREGLRFTDAYAAAPVCSPARASLLTGMAPARLGITNHVPESPRFAPKGAPFVAAPTLNYLPTEHVTLAERLGEAGYSTPFVGKWHLCGDWSHRDGGAGDPAYHPERQGFELNIAGCARGGPTTYWDPYNIHAIESNTPGEYLPDRLAREVIGLLRERVDDPFFLCWWPYTPHYPLEAPPELVEKYEARGVGPGIKNTTYAAMVEAMDASIGRVLDELDRLELAEETLVIFLSDNGGWDGVCDNRPLKAGKGYLYEGGIRVPLVIRWPGRAAPGVSSTPVVSTDLFATVLEAAGLEPTPDTPLDGESLVPLFDGEGALKRDAIFFHYPNYAFHGGNRLGGAVRSGPWKLIENFYDGSLELYDLEADIGERSNVAGAHPETATALVEMLRGWRAEVGAKMPMRLPGAQPSRAASAASSSG
ncbi:MAG: sulfatase [Planctomycetes bacterium]|nr:sulfatase [Planctomycetota bacterium]